MLPDVVRVGKEKSQNVGLLGEQGHGGSVCGEYSEEEPKSVRGKARDIA